jgi:uncharacterized cupin superfamily protein
MEGERCTKRGGARVRLKAGTVTVMPVEISSLWQGLGFFALGIGK